MIVHLIDGTYELFRSYFGAPKARVGDREIGATRGILRSLLALLREDGVSHVAIAFDHVIESFRNELFYGYKTSAGVPDDIHAACDARLRVPMATGTRSLNVAQTAAIAIAEELLRRETKKQEAAWRKGERGGTKAGKPTRQR